MANSKYRQVRMEVIQMQSQLIEYMKALFLEGFLDAQFLQLQQLQDEANPDFVAEVLAVFFDDAERLLNDLRRTLEQETVDYRRLDAHVHQFKGSSASVGANRVKNACIAFRNLCDEQNVEALLSCLEKIREEFLLVKGKLETLFTLEQRILAAGGVVPMLELTSS